jgi:hypothetical protein
MNKHHHYQQIAERIKHTTDTLGMPIDPLILPVVIWLTVWGIPTRASCEGHIDRGMPYPWVDIGRNDIRTLEKQAFQQDQPGEARTLHLAERQKLIELLDRFYEHHHSSYDTHLIIQDDWMGLSRLQSQGAHLQEIRNEEERQQKLSLYQAEMQAFADFLKDQYFA